MTNFVVTTLDDSGPGTLRDVISRVDVDPIANGARQITFANGISGGTIALGSPLPALTRDQVTVIGPITLDGSSAGGDGLDISGDQDSVQDVIFTGFSGAGVSITGNDDSVTGSQISGNQNGITVSAGATANTIGGTAKGAGNVITGNVKDGIALNNVQETLIQGNWIGTDSSSTTKLGNGNDGIEISDGATGNTIGGTIAGAGNVIASNADDGTELDNAQQTVIQGNWVGTDPAGDGSLGNGAVGILIADGGSDNVIGLMPSDNTTPVDQNPTANVIANNGADGVLVLAGVHNTIRGNLIYGNKGLAINLGGGTTPKPNSLTFSPSDPNEDVNYPGLSVVNYPNVSSVASGIFLTLVDVPDEIYTFDFYLVGPDSASFVARHSYTTDDTGTFFAPIPNLPAVPDGMYLTATATEQDGNTSEMLPVIGNVGFLAVPGQQSPPFDPSQLVPNLQTALGKFKQLLNADSDPFDVTSGYRSTAIQAFWYELRTKYLQLASVPGIEGTNQSVGSSKRPQLIIEPGGAGPIRVPGPTGRSGDFYTWAPSWLCLSRLRPTGQFTGHLPAQHRGGSGYLHSRPFLERD